MKKVMVAVDETEGSMYALQWILHRLFTPPDSGDPVRLRSLIILHVQQPLHHYLSSAASAVHTTSVASFLKKAQEENTTKVVTRATEICKARKIIAETIVLDGEPKDVICHIVELMEINLLAVGSHGHSKLKRSLLGGVSDHVAHHARCPVLIVKPPNEQH